MLDGVDCGDYGDTRKSVFGRSRLLRQEADLVDLSNGTAPLRLNGGFGTDP